MNKQIEKKSSYDKNPELILKYREGDECAGEELVKLNTPLIYSIAGRFSGRGVETSDLIECGMLGLVKAINTFDINRGCAFSTYAVPLIFGEMRRFIRDDGAVKVSREEKRLSAQIAKERERRQNSGERCDVASLALALGVSMQDAASAIYAEMPVRSLDECVYDDDEGVTLGSTLTNEEESEHTFERIALGYAIEGLSDMHKKLILLRYFRDMSQADTARILGLSQVKVSREEKKILLILKGKMI